MFASSEVISPTHRADEVLQIMCAVSFSVAYEGDNWHLWYILKASKYRYIARTYDTISINTTIYLTYSTFDDHVQ